MKRLRLAAGGFFTGTVNAFLGAGGGMLAVPILCKSGLSQKEAQATAVSVILPLTLITAAVYYFSGNISLSDAWQYIPFGFLGGITGSFILSRLSDKLLKRAFALFMIWAGVRMLFR